MGKHNNRDKAEVDKIIENATDKVVISLLKDGTKQLEAKIDRLILEKDVLESKYSELKRGHDNLRKFWYVRLEAEREKNREMKYIIEGYRLEVEKLKEGKTANADL